ncbi:hypothetical protein QBC41DRAFT_321679 [Cercophora samala]|uniref:holo-[acyl-carrier-protein] synthase n=1 Tax=Cercophora samala TaxID=330535 RepID=A0AA39ZD32_9PEZI|nr:hypothetical protein QBC41DRAFT_321679 [Cercophora samala]
MSNIPKHFTANLTRKSFDSYSPLNPQKIMASPSNKKGTVLVQWILDTRFWYPEATQTKHLETRASRALSLLPEAERTAVLRYFHIRDAKMSLASHLLKHYAVAKLTPTPWSATTITRNSKTKPVYIDPSTGQEPVSFNVTHQAGIVALVAVANYPPSHGPADTGIDIVCTSERRDRDQKMILTDPAGWPGFVDMHADVFSPGEVSYLKYRVLSAVPGLVSGSKPEDLIDGKLRAFYALWALREAYIKLTGEALLAEWLRELEFVSFRPPRPTEAWGVPAREDDVDTDTAQVIRKFDIRFRGEKVEDVNMCLRSMGPDYMIATAVRTSDRKEDALGWELGPYEFLDLNELLDFAEAHR